MSAVAKLRSYGQAAVEEILAPLIDHHERQQRATAEADALNALEQLAKYPRTTKALREAEAKVAKAKADKARAEADLALAKARVAEMEVEFFALSQAHASELRTLRLAATAPHIGADVRERLNLAIEDYTARVPSAFATLVLKPLFKARNQLSAILDGADDPPAEGLPLWLDELLSASAARFEEAVRLNADASAQHAAHARAVRLLG